MIRAATSLSEAEIAAFDNHARMGHSMAIIEVNACDACDACDIGIDGVEMIGWFERHDDKLFVVRNTHGKAIARIASKELASLSYTMRSGRMLVIACIQCTLHSDAE